MATLSGLAIVGGIVAFVVAALSGPSFSEATGAGVAGMWGCVAVMLQVAILAGTVIFGFWVLGQIFG